MAVLESAWLLVPLAIYAVVMRWVTLRADRAIPRSFKSLPRQFNWPRQYAYMDSRRFALWQFPVLGGTLGLIIVAIDVRFAVTGPHLHSLQARLFTIVWSLVLFAVLQLLMLWLIRRWVSSERARQAEQRRKRRKELKADAGPATPPAT